MEICGIYIPCDLLLVLGKGLFTISPFYGLAFASTCHSASEVLNNLCSRARHQLSWYGTDGFPGILFAGVTCRQMTTETDYSLPNDTTTSWQIAVDGHPQWRRGLLGVGVCDEDGILSRGWD